MQINPEIQRNIWLDFSLHRLLALPAILGVIYLITYFISASTEGASQQKIFSDLIYVSFWLFNIIVLYWGSYRATGAIIEELNENTWDYQRLSSVSPWSLCLGKLFGSTLYIWYGAFFCLLVFIILSLQQSPPDLVLRAVLIMGLGGLLSHALAFLIGMQTLRSPHKSSRRRMLGYRILGLVSGYGISMMITALSPLSSYSEDVAIKQIQPSAEMMYFLNYQIPVDDFTFFSLWIFLFWVLIGIYRSMRLELQLRTLPWVWVSFIVFMMVYLGGISSELKPWVDHNVPLDIVKIDRSLLFDTLRAGIVIGLFSTYFMFFSDRISIIRYRMMFYHFQRGAWAKALEFVPKLAFSYCLALLCLLFTGIFASYFQREIPSLEWYILILFSLFALRDIGILHFFMLAADNRRGLLATLFYLIVLYGLLPMLAITSGSVAFEDGIFYPVIKEANPLSFFPILLQISIVAVMLYIRWRKADTAIKQSDESSRYTISGQSA